jgi:hypothetical protein
LPHPELEAFRSDQTDQILPAGEQAEPWPLRAVFVETGRSEIGAELQRPRLTEAGRTNPGASSIVDIHEGTLVVPVSESAPPFRALSPAGRLSPKGRRSGPLSAHVAPGDFAHRMIRD